MISRLACLFLITAMLLWSAVSPMTMPIWPGAAPGSPANGASEHDTTKSSDNLVGGKPLIRLGNVSVPTLTVYTPKANSTGAAIVVFPGGGYNILAMDLEGTEVCDWLTSIGVTCAVLKYRVPASGPYPKFSAALQDAQRAVGIVRSHATEWHLDPKRIGVLGFSAGGHLAAAVSNSFDQRLYPQVDAADAISCRPDFTVLIYPAYLANPGATPSLKADIHITQQTPPAFLVQTEDDPAAPVENSLMYYLALKQLKIPAEMHIYAKGGHGYGLRRTELPVTGWPGQLEEWLRTSRITAR